MEHWTEYTRFFTALLVILDPFAAIPLFLALTRGYSAKIQGAAAAIASMTVALVLVAAALTGEQLLHWMGTSLGSFRVGGGIVLMLMALAMLRGQVETAAPGMNNGDNSERSTVAVVPLAIPLLAGPGAISTVIIQMDRSTASYHGPAVIGVIILTSLLLYVFLRLAAPIGNALGQIGLDILNRLFGLILIAIAVEIMANGLRQLFPALG